MIPVQIELCTLSEPQTGRPLPGVCGTCTKCGAEASVAIGTDGGPVARRKAAVAAVLAELTEGCAHPLPWGSVPAHCDRGIPRGVRLFAEESHAGRRWPLSVDGRGKLLTVAGGCHPSAVVLVVPDAVEFSAAAADFAAELVKRGYVNATTVPPEEAACEKAEAKS